MLFIVKVVLSALILVGASELAKRSPFWGAVVIAMPLTSILSLSLLYLDTRSDGQAAQYARDIFYLVPPSLLFFVPFLFSRQTGWPFWLNLASGILLLALAVAGLRLLQGH